MSFWGCTVITNLISAIPYIGTDIVQWVWGGFSINNATLNRFFSLHYLMPFVLTGLVIVHIALLHEDGSNNPMGVESNIDKVPFHPYYSIKDLFGYCIFGLVFIIFVYFFPNHLGHSDNYIPANPLVTPAHIQPEWYFLFAYAILRAIPNKLLGVIALFASLLVLLVLPHVHTSLVRSTQFRPIAKVWYWIFIGNFILLTWIGGLPVESPYIEIGQACAVLYFAYFLVITPLVGKIENKLLYNI